MFETRLRAALLDWLRADPVLAGRLNAIVEEAPLRTSAPWLGLVASASTDWSMKDRQGRDVRLALELHLRGDAPDLAADLTGALESRIEALPANQAGFTVINTLFLRARAEQRPKNQRAVLLEYRFRLLKA